MKFLREKKKLISFNILSLIGIAALYSAPYFQQQAQALKEDPQIIETKAEKRARKHVEDTARINWFPDSDKVFELPDGTLRRQLGQSYAAAWRQYSLSAYYRDADFLDSYFTGHAFKLMHKQAKGTPIINSAKQNFSAVVDFIPVEHTLKLDFLSSSRQVAALTDAAFLNIELIQVNSNNQKYNNLIVKFSEDYYSFLMFRKEGNWRIAKIVRQGHKEATFAKPKTSALSVKESLEEKPLYGMNYYPKDFPWQKFWQNFDEELVRKDFDAIRNLGMNAIRFFIPYKEFSGGNLSKDFITKYKTFLRLVEQYNFQAIVTLFDNIDYSSDEWGNMAAGLRALIAASKGYTDAIIWDVKNEPDFDFPIIGREKVLTWLKLMCHYINSLLPEARLTIGWAKIENTALLKDYINLATFHYYEDPADLATRLKSVQKEIPDHAIMLTEYGRHSFQAWYYPYGLSQYEQAFYIGRMYRAIQKTAMQGHFLWALRDFSYVPTWVLGGVRPWDRGTQAQMGLYDLNDQPKLVVEHLRNQFKENLAEPTWSQRLNESFFYIVGALCIFLLFGNIYFLRS